MTYRNDFVDWLEMNFTLRSPRCLTEELWLAYHCSIDTFMEGVLVSYMNRYHVSVLSLGGRVLLWIVKPILIT